MHATSMQLSIETVGWINDQLRLELVRRQIDDEPEDASFWHQQVLTAIVAGLAGLCCLVLGLAA